MNIISCKGVCTNQALKAFFDFCINNRKTSAMKLTYVFLYLNIFGCKLMHAFSNRKCNLKWNNLHNLSYIVTIGQEQSCYCGSAVPCCWVEISRNYTGFSKGADWGAPTDLCLERRKLVFWFSLGFVTPRSGSGSRGLKALASRGIGREKASNPVFVYYWRSAGCMCRYAQPL